MEQKYHGKPKCHLQLPAWPCKQAILVLGFKQHRHNFAADAGHKFNISVEAPIWTHLFSTTPYEVAFTSPKAGDHCWNSSFSRYHEHQLREKSLFCSPTFSKAA